MSFRFLLGPIIILAGLSFVLWSNAHAESVKRHNDDCYSVRSRVDMIANQSDCVSISAKSIGLEKYSDISAVVETMKAGGFVPMFESFTACVFGSEDNESEWSRQVGSGMVVSAWPQEDDKFIGVFTETRVVGQNIESRVSKVIQIESKKDN